MSIKKLSLIMFLIFVVVLSGCQKKDPSKPEKGTEEERNEISTVDWTDFIRWDQITYENSNVTVPEDQIDSEVGSIEKTAPSKVSMPYEPGDKEAGWLLEGTAVYQVKGCTKEEALAVNVNGVYYVYIPEGGTFPESINPPDALKEDRLECFLAIIDNIYEEDPGLNNEISIVALDMSGMNLTLEEKKLICSGAEERYPDLTVIESNYEQLVQDGYVDREQMYFKEGILITIQEKEYDEEQASMKFSVKKWRSGLGAIGSDHGTAVYEGGKWNVTLKDIWIS